VSLWYGTLSWLLVYAAQGSLWIWIRIHSRTNWCCKEGKRLIVWRVEQTWNTESIWFMFSPRVLTGLAFVTIQLIISLLKRFRPEKRVQGLLEMALRSTFIPETDSALLWKSPGTKMMMSMRAQIMAGWAVTQKKRKGFMTLILIISTCFTHYTFSLLNMASLGLHCCWEMRRWRCRRDSDANCSV